MIQETVSIPRPASPNIDEVLDEFLREQRLRLKRAVLSHYESVIDLLQQHLNGYAYESLSKPESALFDKHYNAKGEDHREFCQLFGPDKIVGNLGMFLGYFMIRKVMAGATLKRAAGTVTKRLSKWLAEKGYTSNEAAAAGQERGADAARDLPKAERAAKILFDAADAVPVNPNELADENYLEFDHFTLGKVEPGKLWLDVYEGGRTRLLGPITAPKKATDLVQEGWEISCGLGRVRGKWRIIEMGNIYP
ncbi:MAG: hypothetical protein HY716_02065 [Planctomycetes bacterium]|nr:hypothetical protein [Planctomycetota bacterium]